MVEEDDADEAQISVVVRCGVIRTLYVKAVWNMKIVVHTKRGKYSSQPIRFNKGLPQGDLPTAIYAVAESSLLEAEFH